MAETVNDTQFAEIAVKLKLLTEAQITELRMMQEQMKSMGFPAVLEEIAQRKEFLNANQVRHIHRACGIGSGKIPGYSILQKLAKGGMGVVYKARQNSVDRIVAIKVLSSLLTDDASFVKRFMNEAKSVAKLSHPNIISVFDAGEAEGLYYFAMEFIEGQTIADIVEKNGPMPEDQVRKILLQIAEALRYIHAQGMIHRDIKPENIMVDKKGVVKIGDFGLAKMPTNSGLTDPGSVMGTPRYISPEQAQGEKTLDIRSDLYSLGATIYFMLTGQAPYDGPTSVAIVLKHMNEPIPNVRQVRGDVTESMALLVEKLMQKKPIDRLQNPAQLISVLKGVSIRTIAIKRSTQLAAAPKKKKGKELVILALCAVPLLLGAAFVLWPNKPIRPPPPPIAKDPPKVDTPKPKDPEPVKPSAVDEGLALMKEKKWAEAAALLKGVSEPQYKACMAEIETASLLQALDNAAKSKRWKEVGDLADKLNALDTITAGERKADVNVIATRARHELQAEKLIADAHTQADANSWSACLDTLNKLEGFAQTSAYVDAQRKLEDLRKRHVAWQKQNAEQAAEKLWNRAVLAVNEKEYIRAKGLFQDFLNDAVGTMFYASRREDAMRRIRDCDDAMGAEKESTAQQIFSEAQKARAAKDYAKMIEQLDRLDRSFQDTKAYKSNAKTIADMRKSVEKEIKDLAKIIDTFENGVDKWQGHSEDVEKPKVEQVSDAREGKKAMKISFVKMNNEDDTAMVLRSVDGLTDAATGFRFWAKPGQTMAKQRILLILLQAHGDDAGLSIFIAEIPVQAGWKEYAVPLMDLAHVRNIGKVATNDLILSNVRAIGIAAIGKLPAYSVTIDGFRLDTKE
jgi:serine/threonine-protein kinase